MSKTEKRPPLPRSFRKADALERIRLCSEHYDIRLDLSENPVYEYLDLADVMVENSIGIMPVPLGLACGFLIDGNSLDIPMATEEPSVIAAASFAAGIIRMTGGFTTWATDPVMTFQVFLPLTETFNIEAWLNEHKSELEETAKQSLETIEKRGGGFKNLIIEKPVTSKNNSWIKLEVEADVRDAMGANRLNSAAEKIAEYIEEKTGVRRVMAILSNASLNKRSGASFSIPFESLERIKGNGKETAQLIVCANEIAISDISRAVTHNKGIMNGISALALATGNDTRAIEAAVHSWASRSGSYRGLTEYSIKDNCLNGSLEIPAPFASVGGSVSFHPVSQAMLEVLGSPDAATLSRTAAAVGLAQNFAALLALTGDGIQKGHMLLHARKLAYQAGARGGMIQKAASEMHKQKTYTLDAARKLVSQLTE